MRWPGGVAPFDLAQVTTSPTTCITLRNGSVLASSSDLLRSTRVPAAASAASASGRCSAERRAMDWIASVIEYVHGPCELSTYRTTTLVISTCARNTAHRVSTGVRRSSGHRGASRVQCSACACIPAAGRAPLPISVQRSCSSAWRAADLHPRFCAWPRAPAVRPPCVAPRASPRRPDPTPPPTEGRSTVAAGLA